jgi:hypothetical protein
VAERVGWGAPVLGKKSIRPLSEIITRVVACTIGSSSAIGVLGIRGRVQEAAPPTRRSANATPTCHASPISVSSPLLQWDTGRAVIRPVDGAGQRPWTRRSPRMTDD